MRHYFETKASDDAVAEENKPAASKQKSLDDIAHEVRNGRWGKGTARRILLTLAGYNYKEVQARVNQLEAEKKK